MLGQIPDDLLLHLEAGIVTADVYVHGGSLFEGDGLLCLFNYVCGGDVIILHKSLGIAAAAEAVAHTDAEDGDRAGLGDDLCHSRAEAAENVGLFRGDYAAGLTGSLGLKTDLVLIAEQETG